MFERWHLRHLSLSWINDDDLISVNGRFICLAANEIRMPWLLHLFSSISTYVRCRLCRCHAIVKNAQLVRPADFPPYFSWCRSRRIDFDSLAFLADLRRLCMRQDQDRLHFSDNWHMRRETENRTLVSEWRIKPVNQPVKLEVGYSFFHRMWT